MTTLRPPAYIVWSTDQVDLSDPFQRRWYIQPVLSHGRIEDIRTLNTESIHTRKEIFHSGHPTDIQHH